MSTWSTSDWLMFRPVLTLACLSIVTIAAWAVITIRKWIALHAKRRAARTMVATPDTLPNHLAMPEVRRQVSREAANDGRPRAA